MAHTFLVFDFGEDESTAHQARLRIEGWKQGFRLDQKVQLVFERSEGEAQPESAKKKSQAGKQAASGISLIVRLDFSDHEKLSQQRWLDRIPSEEPFNTVKGTVVRSGDPEFAATAARFDALAGPASAAAWRK